MGEFLDVTVGRAGVALGERLADGRVGTGPLERPQTGVGGLPDQVVDETELRNLPGRHVEQSCLDRRLEGREELGPRTPGRLGERHQREAIADHGPAPQRLDRRLRHVREALLDQRLDPDRHPQRQHGILGENLEPSFAHQHPEHFVNEKRVPASGPVQVFGHLGPGFATAAMFDHSADLVGLEAGQREPLGCPEQLRGQRGEPTGPHFDLAVGSDHEHAHLGELTRDEQQRQQRELIGGVEIVEHDHQRTFIARAAQEPRERVEQYEARLLGVERRLAFELRERVVQLGNDRREHGRRRAKLVAQGLRVSTGEQLA